MDSRDSYAHDFYICYTIVVQGNFSPRGHLSALHTYAILIFTILIVNEMLCHSGAKNIITACQECKVKRLVYNSSAEVVLNSWQDIHGGDESLPYSSKVSLLSAACLTRIWKFIRPHSCQPSSTFFEPSRSNVPHFFSSF